MRSTVSVQLDENLLSKDMVKLKTNIEKLVYLFGCRESHSPKLNLSKCLILIVSGAIKSEEEI
jgi:hypothetical protein